MSYCKLVTQLKIIPREIIHSNACTCLHIIIQCLFLLMHCKYSINISTTKCEKLVNITDMDVKIHSIYNKNRFGVGSIASISAQHSATYGYALERFLLIVGHFLL